MQARSQNRIWGGAEPPQQWTFWTQKVDFLNITPLNPPTKTPFLAHFVPKVDLLFRFGGVRCTPVPPGYGPANM